MTRSMGTMISGPKIDIQSIFVSLMIHHLAQKRYSSGILFHHFTFNTQWNHDRSFLERQECLWPHGLARHGLVGLSAQPRILPWINRMGYVID